MAERLQRSSPAGSVFPRRSSGFVRIAPLQVSSQIDILRSHWPSLNPDKALHFMRTVYPTLRVPEWVEGPFVRIRSGFFSDDYGQEVLEVLKTLKKVYGTRFINYKEGKLGSANLRQSALALAALEHTAKQQKGSDILIGLSQSGARYLGRTVRRVRDSLAYGEFGESAKDIATMILANPGSKTSHECGIECAGDEHSPNANGVFEEAPFFGFGRKVEFDTSSIDRSDAHFGSASGFAPGMSAKKKRFFFDV